MLEELMVLEDDLAELKRSLDVTMVYGGDYYKQAVVKPKKFVDIKEVNKALLKILTTFNENGELMLIPKEMFEQSK